MQYTVYIRMWFLYMHTYLTYRYIYIYLHTKTHVTYTLYFPSPYRLRPSNPSLLGLSLLHGLHDDIQLHIIQGTITICINQTKELFNFLARKNRTYWNHVGLSKITRPKNSHSLKYFPFGARPIFRGELLVSGRISLFYQLDKEGKEVKSTMGIHELCDVKCELSKLILNQGHYITNTNEAL